MKKPLLIIALVLAAFISKAQTTQFLADSSFAKHDYAKAFDYYSKALKANPDNIADIRSAGACLVHLDGQELNAVKYFNAALKIQPNDPIADTYLGIIYRDAAKEATDPAQKAHYKTLAEIHLSNAANHGSQGAASILKQLNNV